MDQMIRNFPDTYCMIRKAINRTLMFAGLLPFLLTLSGCEAEKPVEAISFREIQKQPETNLGEPRHLKATDGVDLAFYIKLPPVKPAAMLIFLHGGGAYSEAGYQHLAGRLSQMYGVGVCLTDLRGHGYSGGPRGDAPSVEQVWDDLRLLATTMQNKYPDIPLYLGGHSSGAGLILNYLTWKRKADVDGCFLIAPQLGYKSDTARADAQTSFAKARIWVFALSALSGGRLLAHTPAVEFNYPEAVLAAKPLMLKSITRNMALAITPDNPREQFRQMDKPFGLFIGDSDDLFVPEKVLRFADDALAVKARSTAQVVKNENHLSILLVAGDLIGETIHSWLQNPAGKGRP